MNYTKWIEHFQRNRQPRPEPDWDAPVNIPGDMLPPLLRSIEEFRLGDGGGPASLIAYDLLEHNARDIRMQPLVERREQLEALLSLPGTSASLRLSPVVRATDWTEVSGLRTRSRALGVEGMMVKRRESAYGVGRVRGAWWKWKIEPYSVDAVIIYAQRGHGKRAGLYTRLHIRCMGRRRLVPFAKAFQA